jgi:DHA2 family methylenomycin A resistance protein-like MFS transporter
VTFWASVATQALSNFGQYLLLFMVPAVLDAQNWSSRSEGYVLTAMTTMLIVTGPIGGRMADRTGRARPMLGGYALAAVGMAALVPFGKDTTALTFVITLAIFGTGYGLAGPPLNAAAIEAVTADRTGVAAGVLSASRYIGSIVSTILISSLVADDASGSTMMFVIGLGVLLASIATAVVVVRARPPRSPAKGVGRPDGLHDHVGAAVHDKRLPEHEAGVGG